VLFDQNLTPAMLRAVLDKTAAIFATPDECSGMIASFIAGNDLSQITTISTIAQKM
jgi:hypothetical protein